LQPDKKERYTFKSWESFYQEGDFDEEEESYKSLSLSLSVFGVTYSPDTIEQVCANGNPHTLTTFVPDQKKFFERDIFQQRSTLFPTHRAWRDQKRIKNVFFVNIFWWRANRSEQADRRNNYFFIRKSAFSKMQ